MLQPLVVLAVPMLMCTADAGPAAHGSAGPVAMADSLEQTYRTGLDWTSFYDGVDARRELWTRNWTNARVPAELAARARAVGGPWYILVITVPGCSDSANSIPYLAKLAELTPGLELRVVDSTVGRPWMAAHRAPDGRAATPTVLVLDDAYRLRGCWVEQPAALQEFWLPVLARGAATEQVGQKLAWYARDEGRETLREFVEVLEGARSGAIICPGD